MITIYEASLKHPAQISLFLRQLKEFVVSNGLILVDRAASRNFMLSRGMSMTELIDLVLSLDAHDCIDGPEADRDPRYSENWTVAEFAPVHRSEKLYVKLSVRMDAERCKCLSIKLWTNKGEA